MGFPFQDLIGVIILAVLIAAPIVLWKRRKRIVAVVFGVLVVLLWIAIALPSFMSVHTQAHLAMCVNNLKVIENAKAAWAKENGKQPLDVPTETDLASVDKQLSQFPRCPDGGVLTIGPVNQRPTCSLAKQGHAISDDEH